MYGHNIRPTVDINMATNTSLSYGNPKAITLGGVGGWPPIV